MLVLQVKPKFTAWICGSELLVLNVQLSRDFQFQLSLEQLPRGAVLGWALLKDQGWEQEWAWSWGDHS